MAHKPTILFDTQIFDIQNFGGISRYFANLIAGLQEDGFFEPKLPIIHSTNYYVQDFPKAMNCRLGNIIAGKPKTRDKLNKWNVKNYLRRNQFDIFHPTYYNPYFLDLLKKPLVITIHDMIYENFADSFKDSHLVISQKKSLLQSADLIIAISEFTKQQIVAHYPYLFDKVHVIYHGIPKLQVIPTQELLPAKFLLYVGDRHPVYKNFMVFIEAIAPLIKHQKDIRLVCAGGGKFSKSETDQFEKYGLENVISQLDASDELIKQLYQNATIFVYPSLEEGFGLPILEAFENGCPVACSNTSCFPEVGGNAVTYFDPNDIKAINHSIKELMYNSELRDSQRLRGLQQLKNFTFENCLDKTIACYRTLL